MSYRSSKMQLKVHQPTDTGKIDILRENLDDMDIFASASFESISVFTPPTITAFNEGKMWVVPDLSTGAWFGRDGSIATIREGSWFFYDMDSTSSTSPGLMWKVWIIDRQGYASYGTTISSPVIKRWTWDGWSLAADGSWAIGVPTAGALSSGDVNVFADIYKETSAYTFPDYVFKQHFTGNTEEGREGYPGLLPIPELEKGIKEHWCLEPLVDKKPTGAFTKLDILLETVEHVYLYLIYLDKKTSELERKLDANP